MLLLVVRFPDGAKLRWPYRQLWTCPLLSQALWTEGRLWGLEEVEEFRPEWRWAWQKPN